jgi:hypothetical protein
MHVPESHDSHLDFEEKNEEKVGEEVRRIEEQREHFDGVGIMLSIE